MVIEYDRFTLTERDEGVVLWLPDGSSVEVPDGSSAAVPQAAICRSAVLQNALQATDTSTDTS